MYFSGGTSSHESQDDKKHTVEPARAVAQGFYALVELDGHVHLAYALDEPKVRLRRGMHSHIALINRFP